jgi:hypothetical protein
MEIMESLSKSQIEQLDCATKRIMELVVNQQDVFEITLQSQTAGIEAIREDMVDHLETHHVATRRALTLQNRDTRAEINTMEIKVVDSVQVVGQANRAEHERTQSQIKELREALDLLSNQIHQRDLELKDLLNALNRTKDKKQRKSLGEKSNTVTAALLALETVYRSLRVRCILNVPECKV